MYLTTFTFFFETPDLAKPAHQGVQQSASINLTLCERLVGYDFGSPQSRADGFSDVYGAMARCAWRGACSHMAVRCGQCGPSCAHLGPGFMPTRHRLVPAVRVRSAPGCARPRATRQHGGQLARLATLVPLRLGQAWRCLTSMDSDFEAVSRNPTGGSFAVLAFS